MAGLVPAIHVFSAARKARMAATSAAMTTRGLILVYLPFERSISRRARRLIFPVTVVGSSST
jgi:hypothetical protein